MDQTTEGNDDSPVSFREAVWTWCRVAMLSFGGPAGQIAVMHRMIVDEKKWISEERFLHALNYCMLLPGPEAQQLAMSLRWLCPLPQGHCCSWLDYRPRGYDRDRRVGVSYDKTSWMRRPCTLVRRRLRPLW